MRQKRELLRQGLGQRTLTRMEHQLPTSGPSPSESVGSSALSTSHPEPALEPRPSWTISTHNTADVTPAALKPAPPSVKITSSSSFKVVKAPAKPKAKASRTISTNAAAKKPASKKPSAKKTIANKPAAAPGRINQAFSDLTALLPRSDTTCYTLPWDPTPANAPVNSTARVSRIQDDVPTTLTRMCSTASEAAVTLTNVAAVPVNASGTPMNEADTSESTAVPMTEFAGPQKPSDSLADTDSTPFNAVAASTITACVTLPKTPSHSTTNQHVIQKTPERVPGGTSQTSTDDEIQIVGTNAINTANIEDIGYRPAVNLQSGGRQNNFPVKIDRGRHIYYRVSDQRFIVLVCPVARCRHTDFSTIQEILAHLTHDHLAYHSKVPIRNYEEALDAFGKSVESISFEGKEMGKQVTEVDEETLENSHLTPSVSKAQSQNDGPDANSPREEQRVFRSGEHHNSTSCTRQGSHIRGKGDDSTSHRPGHAQQHPSLSAEHDSLRSKKECMGRNVRHGRDSRRANYPSDTSSRLSSDSDSDVSPVRHRHDLIQSQSSTSNERLHSGSVGQLTSVTTSVSQGQSARPSNQQATDTINVKRWHPASRFKSKSSNGRPSKYFDRRNRVVGSNRHLRAAERQSPARYNDDNLLRDGNQDTEPLEILSTQKTGKNRLCFSSLTQQSTNGTSLHTNYPASGPDGVPVNHLQDIEPNESSPSRHRRVSAGKRPRSDSPWRPRYGETAERTPPPKPTMRSHQVPEETRKLGYYRSLSQPWGIFESEHESDGSEDTRISIGELESRGLDR